MTKHNLPNLSSDSLTTEVLAILICGLKDVAPDDPVINRAWDNLFNELTERVGAGLEEYWLAAAAKALSMMNTTLGAELAKAASQHEEIVRYFALRGLK